jgi:hypothetical protein
MASYGLLTGMNTAKIKETSQKTRRKVDESSARRRELHCINRKRPQNNYNPVVNARGGFGCELLPLSVA